MITSTWARSSSRLGVVLSFAVVFLGMLSFGNDPCFGFFRDGSPSTKNKYFLFIILATFNICVLKVDMQMLMITEKSNVQNLFIYLFNLFKSLYVEKSSNSSTALVLHKDLPWFYFVSAVLKYLLILKKCSKMKVKVWSLLKNGKSKHVRVSPWYN